MSDIHHTKHVLADHRLHGTSHDSYQFQQYQRKLDASVEIAALKQQLSDSKSRYFKLQKEYIELKEKTAWHYINVNNTTDDILKTIHTDTSLLLMDNMGRLYQGTYDAAQKNFRVGHYNAVLDLNKIMYWRIDDCPKLITVKRFVIVRYKNLDVDKVFEELYDNKEKAEDVISKMKIENPDYTYNVSSIDVLAHQK